VKVIICWRAPAWAVLAVKASKMKKLRIMIGIN